MAEIGKFEKNRSAWLNLKRFEASNLCHAKRIFYALGIWPGPYPYFLCEGQNLNRKGVIEDEI